MKTLDGTTVRPPDDPEWTAARIDEKVSECVNMWGPRKVEDQKRVDQYFGEEGTEAPSPQDRKKLIVDPKIVKGRRAMEIIDFYTGVLAINTEYTVEAYGADGQQQENAENATTWLNASGPAMEFQSGEDTNLEMTREALTVGYSAKKTLPFPQALGDWPMRSRSPDDKRYTEDPRAYSKRAKAYEESIAGNKNIPIREWHVPALTWFPLLHGRNVLLHIEKKKVPYAWIRGRYRNALEGITSTYKDTDEVEFVEIIDPTWCGYYLQGDDARIPLKFWKHEVDLPDGQVPVSIFECNKIGGQDLVHRWMSLIESIRDILALEDFLLTQEASVVRAFWQVTVVLELMEGFSPTALASAQNDRKFQVGGTNFEFKGADGQSGEKYRLFESPQKLPDAASLQQYVNMRVQSFLPPSLTGASPEGDSGYKDRLGNENAERKLEPPANNFARGDADAGRHRFACVRAIGKIQNRPDARVYVRESTGPDSKPLYADATLIKGLDTQIRATREYILNTDFLGMADAATKYLEDPIRAPRRWVGQNILRWNNPREMDEERLQEDIAQDPAFREKDIENALLDLGVKNVNEYGMSTQDIASILAEKGVLPPGIFLPRNITETPQPNAGIGPAAAAAPADGSTVTPGPGVAGADPATLESPAAAAPTGPAPGAVVDNVSPTSTPPPVQSGRGGSARRQPSKPRQNRAKGKSK